MKNVTGGQQQKITSSPYPISIPNVWVETIFLLLLGALAVTLKAKLRIGMGMPGRHGVEIMTLFMSGRCISRYKYASSITAFGGILFMFVPFLGFKDPFLPFIYFTMGVELDLLFAVFKNMRKNIWVLSLTSGLVYTTIPLVRIFFSQLFMITDDSLLKHGMVYPLLTHFMFGFAGGLISAGLMHSLRRKKVS